MDGMFIAVMVLMMVLLGHTWLRMGSYFDRRLSDTEEDVQADIEKYGADAPGIRSELLRPEDRLQVRSARRKAREADPD
jgi:hypothetical protein